MMCPWNIFRGYIFYQFPFYLERGISRLGYQSESMADTKNVGVHRHRRLSKSNTLNHIGRLTTYTRQVEQLVHVCRNLSLVFLHQLAGHLYKMLCFGVRIGYATNIFQDVVHLSLCHRGCIRIVAEKFGSHLVDTLVRALGTQDNSNQQLENASELQLRLDVRHFTTEKLQDICVAFLFIHTMISSNIADYFSCSAT